MQGRAGCFYPHRRHIRRPPRGAGNAALRPAAGRGYAALWSEVADERSGSKAAFRSAGVRLCTPAAAGLTNKRIAVKRRARLCRKAQELGLALFQALPDGGKSGPLRVAFGCFQMCAAGSLRRAACAAPGRKDTLCAEQGEMTAADNHEAMYRDTKKDAYRAFRLFCARGSDM